MTSVGSAVLMIVLILLNLCLLKYLFHESRVKYGSQILGMCREHQSLRMFLQFFAVCDPLS